MVFSGDHNDPESWREWSDKGKQEDRIKRFKRKFAIEKTEKTDPLSILVVNNMLLTGFDAPVEQVLISIARSSPMTCCRQSRGSTAPTGQRSAVMSWITSGWRDI